MSGRRSKQKGNRRERQVVAKLEEMGLRAERVPLSGSVGGSFESDILLWLPVFSEAGSDLMYAKAEVKARAEAAGWKTVKKWLGDNQALFLVEDRAEPLVVLPWAIFKAIVGGIYHGVRSCSPAAPGIQVPESQGQGSGI